MHTYALMYIFYSLSFFFVFIVMSLDLLGKKILLLYSYIIIYFLLNIEYIGLHIKYTTDCTLNISSVNKDFCYI